MSSYHHKSFETGNITSGLTKDQLLEMARVGSIKREDYIRKDDHKTWHRADTVKGIDEILDSHGSETGDGATRVPMFPDSFAGLSKMFLSSEPETTGIDASGIQDDPTRSKIEFKVKGALRETAEDVSVVIEAKSYKDAERAANKMGILVNVVLVNSSEEHQNKVNEMRPYKLKRPLLVISICCFIISFFLPVMSLGLFNITGWDAFTITFESGLNIIGNDPIQVKGEMTLDRALRGILENARADTQSSWKDTFQLLTGLWGNYVWITNILFLIIVLGYLDIFGTLGRSKLAKIALFCTIFIMYGIVIMASGETRFFGIGYWVWLLSFALLTCELFNHKWKCSSIVTR
jgi:hypothetical protein